MPWHAVLSVHGAAVPQHWLCESGAPPLHGDVVQLNVVHQVLSAVVQSQVVHGGAVQINVVHPGAVQSKTVHAALSLVPAVASQVGWQAGGSVRCRAGGCSSGPDCGWAQARGGPGVSVQPGGARWGVCGAGWEAAC